MPHIRSTNKSIPEMSPLLRLSPDNAWCVANAISDYFQITTNIVECRSDQGFMGEGGGGGRVPTPHPSSQTGQIPPATPSQACYTPHTPQRQNPKPWMKPVSLAHLGFYFYRWMSVPGLEYNSARLIWVCRIGVRTQCVTVAYVVA